MRPRNSRRRRFPGTDIYCITATEFSLGRSNLEVVKQALEAGVKLVQYREKEFTMLRKYRECLALRELCAEHGACFIVNDDIGLAMAVAADGVHIGQDDLPAEKVRGLVGEEMLVGLSVSSPQQADLAVKSGVVDYLGAGPIYDTLTKKEVSAPVGTELLDYIARHYQIPVVAIGGIKESNVTDVLKHGANCLAMITEIVGSPDIGDKIRAIRRRISEVRGPLH